MRELEQGEVQCSSSSVAWEGEGGEEVERAKRRLLLQGAELGRQRDRIVAGRKHKSSKSCFVFLISKSGACGLDRFCLHHTTIAKRKMRGLDEKRCRLLPALILLFHNFEILSQCSQMEDFTL